MLMFLGWVLLMVFAGIFFVPEVLAGLTILSILFGGFFWDSEEEGRGHTYGYILCRELLAGNVAMWVAYWLSTQAWFMEFAHWLGQNVLR